MGEFKLLWQDEALQQVVHHQFNRKSLHHVWQYHIPVSKEFPLPDNWVNAWTRMCSKLDICDTLLLSFPPIQSHHENSTGCYSHEHKDHDWNSADFHWLYFTWHVNLLGLRLSFLMLLRHRILPLLHDEWRQYSEHFLVYDGIVWLAGTVLLLLIHFHGHLCLVKHESCHRWG